MIKFYDVSKENISEHSPNWSETPDHPHRISIFGDSRSGKTNALLNLINHEPDIDKINLYSKDAYEVKYQLVINKRKSTGLHYLND